MSRSSSDVVIVGAGPTGLCLAIELALAGVHPLGLERLGVPDQTAKAGAMGLLAGEALDRRGFAEAIASGEAASAAIMREMARDRPIPTTRLPFVRLASECKSGGNRLDTHGNRRGTSTS